ncbi:hypothetical protein FBZ93_111186 [Bradyrhizobium macuxiense]|uniref:Uncharacterized protein n=1 Tax=Bradyrhizobium macuxiense TaxID=1755647 RepID=A0A560LCV3_9BRAD|nr:hypothetical protein FBZ93_111186 [Bradyrhizobium macuxiense]
MAFWISRQIEHQPPHTGGHFLELQITRCEINLHLRFNRRRECNWTRRQQRTLPCHPILPYSCIHSRIWCMAARGVWLLLALDVEILEAICASEIMTDAQVKTAPPSRLASETSQPICLGLVAAVQSNVEVRQRSPPDHRVRILSQLANRQRPLRTALILQEPKSWDIRTLLSLVDRLYLRSYNLTPRAIQPLSELVGRIFPNLHCDVRACAALAHACPCQSRPA